MNCATTYILPFKKLKTKHFLKTIFLWRHQRHTIRGFRRVASYLQESPWDSLHVYYISFLEGLVLMDKLDWREALRSDRWSERTDGRIEGPSHFVKTEKNKTSTGNKERRTRTEKCRLNDRRTNRQRQVTYGVASTLIQTKHRTFDTKKINLSTWSIRFRISQLHQHGNENNWIRANAASSIKLQVCWNMAMSNFKINLIYHLVEVDFTGNDVVDATG